MDEMDTAGFQLLPGDLFYFLGLDHVSDDGPDVHRYRTNTVGKDYRHLDHVLHGPLQMV